MKLGNWVKNCVELRKKYIDSRPFQHVVIENFFGTEYSEEVMNNFPEVDSRWHAYKSPIETKFLMNNFTSNAFFEDMYKYFSSPAFIDIMKKLTGIDNLESDPYLHGAGLQAYPRFGKTDMHLDYSIHPISHKERRVNLIIYLNKNWKDEYGGALSLFDSDRSNPVDVFPHFNRAIIFNTTDNSYHGVPKPINCPDKEFRRSITVYYVSEPRKVENERHTAEFYPQKEQPVSENLQKLYDIRKTRRLEEGDLWNGWDTQGCGYW